MHEAALYSFHLRLGTIEPEVRRGCFKPGIPGL
jgi:hypothetical protein